jgi:6-phosphogluconolactonase (cycloisomerase 2 family)
MKRAFRLRQGIAAAAVFAAICLTTDRIDPVAGSYLDGESRLISTEPLPGDELCAWPQASANPGPLPPSFLDEPAAAANPNPPNGESRTKDFSQRKPVRTIRDPYPSFATLAVDTTHNEVVIADQNLFQILIYDRLANTPNGITPPKRVLGGNHTEIEFQSSVYVDPQNGDIYAGNNDTVNKLVVFSREQQGDVSPVRELNTPPGRTFGVGVHEAKQHMYLVIQRDDAVVVYPKSAKDDDTPIRLLQGDRTMLADPHDIALDIANNLMFVTNYGARTSRQSGSRRGEDRGPNWPLTSVVPGSGRFDPPSITVHRMDASGNTPPVRMIQGPKTRLNWATGLALDPKRRELFVANDQGDEVLVFDSEAVGDVAPKRIIKGPTSMIENPMDVFLDLERDELWVANFGNHSATVYRRDAAGDAAPLRVIRSGPKDAPAPMMGNPHPVAYDSKRDQILVPN